MDRVARARTALFGGSPDIQELPIQSFFGKGVSFSDITKMTPAQMWETQPHLRTVIEFAARNTAHVGLHMFQRVSEEDRKRVRDNPVSRTLNRPNSETTGYELLFALVGDLLLYDEAYWHVAPALDSPTAWEIVRLPPEWVTPVAADAFRRKRYDVQAPFGEKIEVPAAQVLVFKGYNPTDPRKGSSPINALKDVLQEQMEASAYRVQVWKNGGRVSAVLTRPKDAPRWSEPAKERFRNDWYANYTGRGPRAGGTPILDDGMTLEKVDYSAKDQEYVAGTVLSFNTVCGVYHFHPGMVGGVAESLPFSAAKEYRKMLYGDSLGPLFEQIVDRLNTFLLAMMQQDDDGLYLEFNIKAKLQGSFEEEAAVLSTAVGAPHMTRNEARARQNLPSIAGGDELVTPLNVLVGGQASPQDSGTQNEQPGTEDTAPRAAASAGRPSAKSAPSDWLRELSSGTLKRFFERQERSVSGKLGLKSAVPPDGWWDEDRWNKELGDDLYRVAVLVAGQIGPETASQLGFTPGQYDEARTLRFLRAVADRQAATVNAATKSALLDALSAEDPAEAVSSVWKTASGQRSGAVGVALATAAAAFATTEAGKQMLGTRATKTWHAGRNARPSHAKMSGQTVGINERFSNGADWPGDIALPADERAGCNCSVEVSVAEEAAS